MSMITLTTSSAHAAATHCPAPSQRKSKLDERVSAMREQVLTIAVLSAIAAAAIALRFYMFMPTFAH